MIKEKKSKKTEEKLPEIKKETEKPEFDPETFKEDSNADLKKLIEDNIKWSQVIYTQNKKIKRRLGMMVFAGYLRLFIILAPIILAVIFLPPLIRDLTQEYGSFFNDLTGNQIPFEQIGNILEQFGSGSDVSKYLTPEQMKELESGLQR